MGAFQVVIGNSMEIYPASSLQPVLNKDQNLEILPQKAKILLWPSSKNVSIPQSQPKKKSVLLIQS
jgi:hypothetical protein